MGRHGVRWQGATTLWAYAHKEKQHGLKACQRAPGRLNRVCSAVTRVVNLLVGKILNGHSAMQAVDSGQLRFLGSKEVRTKCYVSAILGASVDQRPSAVSCGAWARALGVEPRR